MAYFFYNKSNAHRALGLTLVISLFLIPRYSYSDQPPKAQALALYYQWKNDVITFKHKQEIKKVIKKSRSAKKRGSKTAKSFAKPGIESTFSYSLLDQAGNLISETFLEEPGIVLGEFQAPGQNQMQAVREELDSADLMVKVTDPLAAYIIFNRYPSSESSSPAPAPSPSPKQLAKFPVPW